jgi:hypothetical protein
MVRRKLRKTLRSMGPQGMLLLSIGSVFSVVLVMTVVGAPIGALLAVITAAIGGVTAAAGVGAIVL